MQFAVPQFTEVEDRLIGSLTLKQFLVLLAAGGIILFFWSLLGPTFPFFLLAAPIAIAGLAAALGRYNGRPLFTYVMPMAGFLTSTKVMVFKREANVTTVSRSQPVVEKAPVAAPEIDEPAESRLKKLAYLMDKKATQEGEIISHDFRQDIIVPQAPKIDLTAALTRSAKQLKDTVLGSTAGRPRKPAPAKAVRTQEPPQRPAAPPAQPARPRPSEPKPRDFDPSSFLQI